MKNQGLLDIPEPGVISRAMFITIRVTPQTR
jgi:hypothetical protein